MFSFLSIFEQSGPIGLFVMGLLVLFSICSWAIILAKWQTLRSTQKNDIKFMESFWQTKDVDSLLAHVNNESLSARVFRDGVLEFERQKNLRPNNSADYLIIERALSRSGRKEFKRIESLLPLLATIGAISPFVGLFGTVVGIMSSFHQIGEAGNANLSTVAPGIAEALLATALGLFAAIPAVMAYNLFQTRIRSLRGDLESFCLDLLAILRSQK